MTYEEEQNQSRLVQYVRAKFEIAKAAKTPIYSKLRECLQLASGQPLTPAGGGPDVAMDISSPVIENVGSLLRDILDGNIEAPFTVKATPQADLSEATMRVVMENVSQALPQLLAASGGDMSMLMEGVAMLKNTIRMEEAKKAIRAAERMEEVVKDKLQDAKWATALAEFIPAFCTFPSAIMKGPVPIVEYGMEWNGEEAVPVKNVVMGVENISPFDFYPAPSTVDVKSADYIIERRRLTRKDIMYLMHLDDYDTDNLQAILKDNPDGVVEPYEGGGERTDMREPSSATEDRDVFDTLGFYGHIRGDLLKEEFGIEVADEHAAYEAEVWIIKDMPIKCVLNPHPLGDRPFHVASFHKQAGSIWGRSPAMQLVDNQKVATATIRALVRNMSFSSGPIGEVEGGRVTDGKNVQQLIPGTVRVVKEGMYGGGAPAYRFHTVPSLANELLATFDKFQAYAYDLIGIPRIAFGGTEGLGTVGRTSGGMSIVMNQSNKAIKHALRNIEGGVITPLVQAFVTHEMLYSNDTEIKGDLRVYAQGVSGILEKEAKATDLEWAFQSVASIAGQPGPDGQPLIPAMAITRILYELFRLKGISTEGIFPDFGAMDALAADTNMPVGSPSLQIPMDGRHGAAPATIADSNGL